MLRILGSLAFAVVFGAGVVVLGAAVGAGVDQPVGGVVTAVSACGAGTFVGTAIRRRRRRRRHHR